MAHIGVYLLLDKSASMYGPAFQVMHEGYYFLQRNLIRYSEHHTLTFSALFYESDTIEICRHNAVLPPLPNSSTGGASRMGQAIKHLASWLHADHSSQDSALAVVIADEMGNDRWQTACLDLEPFTNHVTLLAIACQNETNLKTLCYVREVFHLKDSETLATWFVQWFLQQGG